MYKHLGYQQKQNVEHKLKNTHKKFETRLKCILKTKLNGRNKEKAINSYVLTYSFGVINWSDKEVDSLNNTNTNDIWPLKGSI